eukprot:CAMPEP_0115353956 /NCGR_PEP_ID=MMETSP0270-20121206/98325_1 /TAXON_ID=71861 /ORGANISM="Scrippsiella trochoidea, Strain CCMP3099" /LENGTH=71 /DNA_ID=CAMNT_0002776249 /DNA_START=1 /DNA_END=216 /DNA_ORIENTATION=+
MPPCLLATTLIGATRMATEVHGASEEIEYVASGCQSCVVLAAPMMLTTARRDSHSFVRELSWGRCLRSDGS